MKLVFSRHAWEDYLYLIENIRRSPFKGIGKPEPLKNRLAGYWSRRIDSEHRLVYRIEGESIYIVQARYHY